jgi:hypothetical protein
MSNFPMVSQNPMLDKFFAQFGDVPDVHEQLLSRLRARIVCITVDSEGRYGHSNLFELLPVIENGAISFAVEEAVIDVSVVLNPDNSFINWSDSLFQFRIVEAEVEDGVAVVIACAKVYLAAETSEEDFLAHEYPFYVAEAVNPDLEAVLQEESYKNYLLNTTIPGLNA